MRVAMVFLLLSAATAFALFFLRLGNSRLCSLALLSPDEQADIGIKGGIISGIGKAGNPNTMASVDSNLIVGPTTEAIAGEGLILTAGGLDVHVHFICPQICTEAISAGLTTLLGGGTGPATGTNATTCTPAPFYIKQMLRVSPFASKAAAISYRFFVSSTEVAVLCGMSDAWALAMSVLFCFSLSGSERPSCCTVQATDGIPMNFGFTGKGNSSLPEGLTDMVEAGVVGLKLHEDWGTTPAAIDNCLTLADQEDIAVTLHTDTLNESACLEHSVAAFKGRTIHSYHSEGAGGGHAPDIIKVIGAMFDCLYSQHL